MATYITLTVCGFLSMIVAREMAKRRGLNPWKWFLLAAIFGPLVLPVLYFRQTPA